MKIINEINTLKKILNNKYSICRFGDGELYHIMNSNNKVIGRQKCSNEIKNKLIEIFLSDKDNILIGISGFLTNNFEIEERYILYTDYMKKFIKNTNNNIYKKFPEIVNKEFYSAEITKITNLKNPEEIIKLFDKLFIDNKIIFVGNKIVIDLVKKLYINKFKEIQFIETPILNAYELYSDIKNQCIAMNNCKEYVYLLSIGITATILSYDLAKLGYMAIDLGHYFELLNLYNINNNNIIKKIGIDDKSINLMKERPIYEKSNNIIKRILIVCGDITNIGGAATNSYNLLRVFANNNNYEGIGLFISTLSPKEYTLDPDNLKNIYHAFLDNNIESNLLKLKEEIGKIDIIFCKNYKIFPIVYKIFNCKIIYSPSGIRYIGWNIKDNYIKDLELNGNFWNKINNYKIKSHDNLSKFIELNDKYLEKYVFENAYAIVCNSHLTDSITRSYFKYNNMNTSKIIDPIYLSNITIDNNTYNDFENREYDIGFISISWKRSYKNYSLVQDLIYSNKLLDKKIIIIGNDQNKEKYSKNVTSHDFLNKTDIINLFKKIKTLVIVSKYDSNPNVLVEGVNFGCNIVTSLNIGNSNYIDKQLVVLDYKEVDSWIEKIELSLKKKYYYFGPFSEQITNEFLHIIDKNLSKKIIIGIYKIPALWDRVIISDCEKNKNINYENISCGSFNEHKTRITSIEDNIYLDIFKNIISQYEVEESHYIFIDESINKCKKFIYKNINIWILKSVNELLYFDFGQVYFLRGKYLNFYNDFVPKDNIIIFYPATSLAFTHFNKLKQMKVKDRCKKKDLIKKYSHKEHDFYKRIDYVLIHEDKHYEEIYKYSKRIKFMKFPSNKFIFLNLQRDTDFIFIGDATQKTKNHDCLFDFIKYCEDINYNINIIYVSNENILRDSVHNYIPLTNLKCVDLQYKTNLPPNELNILYNRSKINLVFSGRDASPRTISESLICGCYNIALDTLSDGKDYYDNEIGEIIDNGDGIIEIKESKSIGYINDEIIWKKIIKIHQKNYNHEEISINFKKKLDKSKIIII
jgi:hypothetical protein